MTNIYKLSMMIGYCKHYPDYVKAMFDRRINDYCPIPLDGAIGDDTGFPTIYLPSSRDCNCPKVIIRSQTIPCFLG